MLVSYSKAQKTDYDHSLAVSYLDYHSWHKSAQPDIAESMHWGDHMRRCCVMSRKMGGIKCKLQSGLGFLSKIFIFPGFFVNSLRFTWNTVYRKSTIFIFCPHWMHYNGGM